MSELNNKFGKALHMLLYSWGGDTPSEAMWAFNKFIAFWWDLKSLDGEPPQFTDYLEEPGEEKKFHELLKKHFPNQFNYSQ